MFSHMHTEAPDIIFKLNVDDYSVLSKCTHLMRINEEACFSNSSNARSYQFTHIRELMYS